MHFSFNLKGNKQKVEDYNQDDVVQLLFSFIFVIRKYLSLDSSWGYNINVRVLLVIMGFKLVCKKLYSSYNVYLNILI